jgi:hypothetical protein
VGYRPLKRPSFEDKGLRPIKSSDGKSTRITVFHHLKRVLVSEERGDSTVFESVHWSEHVDEDFQGLCRRLGVCIRHLFDLVPQFRAAYLAGHCLGEFVHELNFAGILMG